MHGSFWIDSYGWERVNLAELLPFALLSRAIKPSMLRGKVHPGQPWWVNNASRRHLVWTRRKQQGSTSSSLRWGGTLLLPWQKQHTKVSLACWLVPRDSIRITRDRNNYECTCGAVKGAIHFHRSVQASTWPSLLNFPCKGRLHVSGTTNQYAQFPKYSV